jgi:hypothetical protein
MVIPGFVNVPDSLPGPRDSERTGEGRIWDGAQRI